MPEKQKLLEAYQEASSKVSELNRNLALGGLAIIWIFKNPESSAKIIPNILIWALFFLVASLLFDLVHYIWRTVVINKTYYKAIKNSEEKADYPDYLKKLSWLFFSLKVIAMAVAYILIFIFLKDKL